METKVCSKEGVKKPLEEFHRDRSSKDGYSSSCAVCRNKVKRKKQKHEFRPNRSQIPYETQKSFEQRELDAKTKCYIAAYKELRKLHPRTFNLLLRREMEKNPIMMAKKWREMPETEGN